MMTIVLIHGLGQSFHSWDKVLPHLKTIHKHFCVDLPPSTPPKSVDSSFLSKRLFCKACDGIDGRIHVVAFSLDGVLALDYALQHADRLESLT